MARKKNSSIDDEEAEIEERRKYIRNKAKSIRFLDVAKQITDTNVILLVGPRKSGKTTIVVQLMRQKSLDAGFVMCPTPEIFKSYGEWVPLGYCWNFFDEYTLGRVTLLQENIRNRLDVVWRQRVSAATCRAALEQRDRWEECKKKFHERYPEDCDASEEEVMMAWSQMVMEDEEYEDEKKRQRAADLDQMLYASFHLWVSFFSLSICLFMIVIVCYRQDLYRPHIKFCTLDDLSSSKEAMKSQLLKKYIDNGRQYLLFLIIGAQDARDIPSGIRGGIDWIGLMFDSNKENIKYLHRYHFSLFNSHHELQLWLEYAQELGKEIAKKLGKKVPERVCMMFDKRTPSRHLEDRLFWYAPGVSDWAKTKLGCPLYQWLNNIYFDDTKYACKSMSTEREEEGIQKLMEAGSKKSRAKGINYHHLDALRAYRDKMDIDDKKIKEDVERENDELDRTVNGEESYNKHKHKNVREMDEDEERDRVVLERRMAAKKAKIEKEECERQLVAKGWSVERRQKLEDVYSKVQADKQRYLETVSTNSKNSQNSKNSTPHGNSSVGMNPRPPAQVSERSHPKSEAMNPSTSVSPKKIIAPHRQTVKNYTNWDTDDTDSVVLDENDDDDYVDDEVVDIDDEIEIVSALD